MSIFMFVLIAVKGSYMRDTLKSSLSGMDISLAYYQDKSCSSEYGKIL